MQELDIDAWGRGKAVASHAEIIGVGGFENQEAAWDEYAQCFFDELSDCFLGKVLHEVKHCD